jgi:hypothetical protein
MTRQWICELRVTEALYFEGKAAEVQKLTTAPPLEGLGKTIEISIMTANLRDLPPKEIQNKGHNHHILIVCVMVPKNISC